MTDLRVSVLSCIEHERLEFELLELRTRGAVSDPVARHAPG